eukprot:1416467-Amphidinium_carterae.1
MCFRQPHRDASISKVGLACGFPIRCHARRTRSSYRREDACELKRLQNEIMCSTSRMITYDEASRSGNRGG